MYEDPGLVPCPTLYFPQVSIASLTQAPSASSPSLWSQECKVVMETMLLQAAANSYNLEPEEQFGVWFWDVEQLSKGDET